MSNYLKLKIVVLFFVMMNCAHQKNTIDHIDLSYIDWTASSNTGTVACGDLNFVFKDLTDSLRVSEPLFLEKIQSELELLSPQKSVTKSDSLRIDVRIEADIVYMRNMERKLCLGKSGDIVLDNQIMKKDKTLWKLFINQINKNLGKK